MDQNNVHSPPPLQCTFRYNLFINKNEFLWSFYCLSQLGKILAFVISNGLVVYTASGLFALSTLIYSFGWNPLSIRDFTCYHSSYRPLDFGYLLAPAAIHITDFVRNTPLSPTPSNKAFHFPLLLIEDGHANKNHFLIVVFSSSLKNKYPYLLLIYMQPHILYICCIDFYENE